MPRRVIFTDMYNESSEADTKGAIDARRAELEAAMQSPTFWQDKAKAHAMIKELQTIKEIGLGSGRYDAGDAIITLFSGAGGDDAEDFSRMLFNMYGAYSARKGWQQRMLHANENDHGGYRNITFEVAGKHAYGTLKHESGVHRLVRQSPFNAKALRQTSFSLVEVVPKLSGIDESILAPEDIKVEFSKAGGPGGQNVNKRETAVRVMHVPTGISVHASSERSQNANREKAIEILAGKLYKMREKEREREEAGFAASKTTDVEWGNQIRSYVLHPYKLVKDHRTKFETRDVDSVLEKGDIDGFIDAMKKKEEMLSPHLHV